nr:MAG TPA: hypothetical protein [Caudoviricetes sp.]
MGSRTLLQLKTTNNNDGCPLTDRFLVAAGGWLRRRIFMAYQPHFKARPQR